MKKGDTLIEVAIAIAVFSLVAIGVVSVVSSSTSASQNSLEVTLTREEIDAQAEALRYIQNSYIAGSRTNSAGNDQYLKLWQEIQQLAERNDGKVSDILNYNPSSCTELYSDDSANNIFTQNAFVINTHFLGNPIDFTDPDTAGQRDDYINNTIFVASDHNDKFTSATTFPRILHNKSTTSQDSLLDQAGNETGMTSEYFSDVIDSVEGIFVVPVADQGTTAILNGAGGLTTSAAFYDFYIRSCWFAPGADRPSTISTVIRLQDPTSIVYDGISFEGSPGGGSPSGDTPGSDEPEEPAGSETTVSLSFHINHPSFPNRVHNRTKNYGDMYNPNTDPLNEFNYNDIILSTNDTFVCWSWSTNESDCVREPVELISDMNFYAIWRINPLYTATFDYNGGSGPTTPLTGGIITLPTPDERPGYSFKCWSTSRSSCDNSNKVGDAKSRYTLTRDITLYAVWDEVTTAPTTRDITFTVTWNVASGQDLDIIFVFADGTDNPKKAWYSAKTVTVDGTKAQMSADGSPKYASPGATTVSESVTVTNLRDDRTYYIYVRNRTAEIQGSSNNVFANTGVEARVGGYILTPPSGSTGVFWNVISIRNGSIVIGGTVTGSPIIK